MALELLFGRKQPLYFTKAGVADVKLLQLDAAPREEHNYQNEVTQYPIEDGANITDHIRRLPERLTVEGFVTNAPVRYLAGLRDRLTYKEGISRVQDGFELLMLMAGYKVATSEERRVTPSEPILVDIFTTLRTFTDMALVSFVVPRDSRTGDSLRFTAEFVRIEKAQLATAVIQRTTEKKTGAGGVNDQAQDNSQVGKQTTGEPKQRMKSVAASLADGLIDWTTPKGVVW